MGTTHWNPFYVWDPVENRQLTAVVGCSTVLCTTVHSCFRLDRSSSGRGGMIHVNGGGETSVDLFRDAESSLRGNK